MIAGSSSIFLKCIWNKSCSWAALLKCWFRTDLGRENSTGFYMQGCVDHALHPIFMFWLVKIWQVSSRGKFMQRLETWLLIAEADRVLCHLVMFKTVFFYLMYKMKYSCYQDCSVIHGWFVYCAFCWQMHRLSKSLEIRRFRMASFSKMSFLTYPCLRRKRVEKSQAILENLMTFRSSIWTGKPAQLLSLMCFFFSVSWSRP